MRNDLITCTLLLVAMFSSGCARGSYVSEETKPAPSDKKDALRKEVEEKLNGMFVAQFQVDRKGITPEARLIEDLKGDELDVVEMIMRVEEGFAIEIPDEHATKLTRVSDFYDYVEKRLRADTRK